MSDITHGYVARADGTPIAVQPAGYADVNGLLVPTSVANAMPFRQIGIGGAQIDDTLPGKIILPDQELFGVYSAALSNDVLFTLDTSNFNSLILEVQQLSAGSLVAETSVDGVNRWTRLAAYNMDQLATPGPLPIMVSTAKFRVPLGSQYTRVRKISDGAAQVQVTGSQIFMESQILPGGTLPFTESTANLISGATFTGTSRSDSAAMGGPSTRFRTFEAEVFSNQAGTLSIYKTIDSGTTWFLVKNTPVTASTTTSLSVQVFAPNYRADFTNTSGSTQTSMLLTSAYRS